MRLRTRSATAGLAAVCLALTVAAAASASPASPDLSRSGPPLDRMFVIMLENHSQSSVIDDPNAPYSTSLAHKYAMADQYYGVTHPSMPNYIAVIAGDIFGLQDDNDRTW